MKKIKKSYRRRVNSRRNSICSWPLESLDWSRWFTDASFDLHYLHVYGPDGIIASVYCRHADRPRLALERGVLYWVIDIDPV